MVQFFTHLLSKMEVYTQRICHFLKNRDKITIIWKKISANLLFGKDGTIFDIDIYRNINI